MTSVLHVISGLGMGGAERMLFQLATALREQGHPQHVVSMAGRGVYASPLDEHGVAVTALDINSAWSAVSGLWSLVRLIARVRPDVLQGWLYHGNAMAALAHRLAPGRSARRLLWNIRSSHMNGAPKYDRIIRVCKFLSRWPDMVVANSRAGMADHLDYGYRPRNREIVPNGIDTGLFRPDAEARARIRTELGIARDAVVALHVARLDPMKDHASFLAAMSRTPDVKGFLVGPGTETLDCPVNVRSLGQRDDVAAVMAGADIIVSTSIWGEGFSNAIAEGMSAGLIPITTDVGDAHLVVGDTGDVMTLPCQIPALAASIGRLAALPAAERTRRGLLGRARIVENFAMARSLERFVRLYEMEPV